MALYESTKAQDVLNFSRIQIIESTYPSRTINCTKGKRYLVSGVVPFQVTGSVTINDYYYYGTAQGNIGYIYLTANSTSFVVAASTTANFSAYVFQLD